MSLKILLSISIKVEYFGFNLGILKLLVESRVNSKFLLKSLSNISSIFPPFGFTLIDNDSPGLALLHILAIESILSPIDSSPSISNLSKELIGNRNSTLEIREGSVPSMYAPHY